MNAHRAFVELNDIDVQAMRSYYAAFGRRALPEGAIFRLSLADSCLPDGHIGFKVWITQVAGYERFAPQLHDWAMGLGATIARMKPRIKSRRRGYVLSYDHSWGRQAAADGLNMAIFGAAHVPSVKAQAEALECDRDAYRRIRDFVAGALLLASFQFEDALRWTHRVARDA